MSGLSAVGVDVSAAKLVVHVRREGSEERLEFGNDPTGHRQLIRRLTKGRRRARVCLESTGLYGLDVALAMDRAERIEVMVLNPRVARRYAEALLERSKTDPGDAAVLADYAQRMDFVAWRPPALSRLELRTLSRRIHQLVQLVVEERNRLHAVSLSEALSLIRDDIENHIAHLEQRIEALEAQALEIVHADDELARVHQLLVSPRGVGERSAIRLLGELAVLPADMTARQWVAHAGLDPREHSSGTSVQKPTRISKQGNTYLRAALYMPAHNAIQHEPVVRAAYDRLRARGKHPMAAKVAIMRRLLHLFHAMIRNDRAFDPSRFGRNNRQDIHAAA
jgi:transposase